MRTAIAYPTESGERELHCPYCNEDLSNRALHGHIEKNNKNKGKKVLTCCHCEKDFLCMEFERIDEDIKELNHA